MKPTSSAKDPSVQSTNQTYSNRVVRSEFDENWTTTLSESGYYVIYVATADNASVEILLADGSKKLITFNKDGQVLVGGGGASHYSKPHTVKTI